MVENKLVAIVDDDEPVRESTAALLRAAGFKVQLFESGDAFLAIEPTAIDCILLDMRMPGSDGIEVLRQLDERASYPPVVVLTGHGDMKLAIEAMKLGAMDFLEKPYEPVQLLNAINDAIAARQSRRRRALPSAEALARIDRLSDRQQQVLSGMVSGEPNKIMAWKLGLSIRTVEAHRAQVMARLGVRSVAEAVQVGLAAGVMSDPGGPATA
jgi:two-component system response regulator FixJ